MSETKTMVHKIKKFISNPRLIVKFIKYKYLFNILYGRRKRFVVNYKGIKTIYSTEDNHSRKWFHPRLDWGKLHEPLVSKRIINSLNQDDVFVDVGTHLGFFTCFVGNFLKEGKVYGFEVDKRVIELSNKNVRLNNLNNVEINNLAVADKNGFVSILKDKRITPGLSIERNLIKDEKHLLVQSISLDSFFKNKNVKPMVIKIDVEGAELLVLKGMQNLLKNENLFLFLEIHANYRLDKFNTNLKDVISFLEGMGYVVYEITEPKGKLRKIGAKDYIDHGIMCYVRKKENDRCA